MKEIMEQVQNYLEGKYKNCNFFDDDRIKDNLESIVDKAYDIIWEALHDADASIDYEIEDFNQNYADEARRVQMINLKREEREEDML